jgi:hypothetical protein
MTVVPLNPLLVPLYPCVRFNYHPACGTPPKIGGELTAKAQGVHSSPKAPILDKEGSPKAGVVV